MLVQAETEVGGSEDGHMTKNRMKDRARILHNTLHTHKVTRRNNKCPSVSNSNLDLEYLGEDSMRYSYFFTSGNIINFYSSLSHET